jgi:hypothetical protein
VAVLPKRGVDDAHEHGNHWNHPSRSGAGASRLDSRASTQRLCSYPNPVQYIKLTNIITISTKGPYLEMHSKAVTSLAAGVFQEGCKSSLTVHSSRVLNGFLGVWIEFTEDRVMSWIISQLIPDFINQCIYNWLGINANCLAKVPDRVTPRIHYGISRPGGNIPYSKKGKVDRGW